MDSTSHVCMGVATGFLIGGIATKLGVDVTSSSIVAVSVAANTMPDIDVLYKLKSNASYINNHRGRSHSLIVSLMWILILTLIGVFGIRGNPPLLYLITATIGVMLHLFTDLLNGYGVQLLWPFQKRWIALGITYTIDAFILISHIVAFGLIIVFHFNMLYTLSILYIIIIIYLVIASIIHYFLKGMLIQKYGRYKRLILQSKSTPLKWKYVYETTDKKFYIGEIAGNNIHQIRYEKRVEMLEPELKKNLFKDKDVQAFLNFAPIYNYTVKEKKDDYGENVTEVKFYDLRYLIHRKERYMYQFNCIAQVKDNKVLRSYIGFVLNDDTAEKKIKKPKAAKNKKQ